MNNNNSELMLLLSSFIDKVGHLNVMFGSLQTGLTNIENKLDDWGLVKHKMNEFQKDLNYQFKEFQNLLDKIVCKMAEDAGLNKKFEHDIVLKKMDIEANKTENIKKRKQERLIKVIGIIGGIILAIASGVIAILKLEILGS